MGAYDPAGSIVHVITGRDGDTALPFLGDWESEEEADGGYLGASGVLPAQLVLDRPNVFRAKSVWRSYHAESGTPVWGGELEQPELDGSGTARLIGRGWGQIYGERSFERVLYQARGSRGWSESFGEPFHDHDTNPNGTGIPHHWTIDIGGGVIKWRGHRHESNTTQIGPPVHFYAPGQELQRFACRIAVDGNSTLTIKFWVEAMNDTDVPDFLGYAQVGVVHNTTYTVPQQANIDVDLTGASLNGPKRYPITLVRIHPVVTSASWTSSIPNVFVELDKIRINGAAGDDNFTASELARDLAERLDVPPAYIDNSEVNVLPYVLKAGKTAAEALDFAAIMAGFRWLFLDTGSGPVLDFGRYSSKRYTVLDERQPFRPIALPVYDSVSVPFRYSDDRSKDVVKVSVDLNLPHAQDFGPLELDNPMPDRDVAADLADRILSRISKQRHSFEARLAQVVDPNGATVSAHVLHAGDTLGHQPTGIDDMWIQKLRRTDAGVEPTGGDYAQKIETAVMRTRRRLRRRRLAA
jgi:hypothetical protein